MRWTLETARQKLERNGGRVTAGFVTHPRPGLKLLGAIDYLVNHCGYRFHRQ